MLTLPVHDATRFVLVRPHYPENVGAAARAIKTMGFTRLALVKPGRLAVPEHEMAHKMAVKAWDVLEGAARHESLAEAIAGVDWVFATTSRRGVSGVLTPRQAAPRIVEAAQRQERVAIVFGNEKTGLAAEDLAQASQYLRIPMAADQPSINLAQAAQLIAYELFVAALEVRNAERGYTPGS
ncbi:MAG TPA: RNA methyltransferase [Polyangiaceae bacterium]|nr:RNA methyltransferase [Polyangiaceae bacterium]